jgi:thiazole synthase/sulfur carrier protein
VKIIVNGAERDVEAGMTIADLVAELNLRTDRIATERNLQVVPKAQYGETQLADGDKLEIVTFVGGG